MAHTVEDLIIEIAGNSTHSDEEYKKAKAMLDEFVEKLAKHPAINPYLGDFLRWYAKIPDLILFQLQGHCGVMKSDDEYISEQTKRLKDLLTDTLKIK